MKLFFPSKSFVIHVRLTEDAAENRWSSTFRNKLKAITISQFIERMLPVPSLMIYDPYNFGKRENSARHYFNEGKFNVGIIGRVTSTKGSFRLPGIIEELQRQDKLDQFQFHFFGDICDDFSKSGLVNLLSSTGAVSFHGYVSDSFSIYNNLQTVLHLSENEPLGRIFLEALNEEIPFIGLNGGGIGEMASMLGMSDSVVDMAGNDINVQIANRLLFVKTNFDKIQSQISEFKELGRSVFDPMSYARKLDSCF
ncbi:glycosyltransferase [Flavihumibacter sp. ZG627]|uniref:glycosyltransferase n=1 Tax=Flavihumibacter sp. ZG627 TaxID=1463156 RepID=UPI0012E01FF5|nr:glycosyltransferase [Flavihumibacter sp. ZG627]